MDFLLEGWNWVLALLAAGSGGVLLWQTLERNRGGVEVAEAVRLFNREKGVLIDVCEPPEFAAGHAAGARNIPLGSLAGAKELPSNKSLPLLLLCASGARAARAATLLESAGYERALAIKGGNAAWREAGMPIDKSN